MLLSSAMNHQKGPAYVAFNGDINDNSTRDLHTAMRHLVGEGHSDITLSMHSGGGNVGNGMALHNFLKSLPIDLTTHNVGDIDSIANVIFLAGKSRFMNANARFMLHGIARAYNTKTGHVSLGEEEMVEGLDYIRQDHARIAETIARHTKLTVKELRRAFKGGDTIVSPQQALAKGIVHEIKDFEIPTGARIMTVSDNGKL